MKIRSAFVYGGAVVAFTGFSIIERSHTYLSLLAGASTCLVGAVVCVSAVFLVKERA